LPPEAQTSLEAQVAAVAAACHAEPDLKTLQELVSPDPQDPLWDLNLMAALGNIRHPQIPLLLAAFFGKSPDRSRRKALKRVLHLLQTRGIPVPGEAFPREEPLIARERAPAVKAVVSPVMGNGDTVIILEAPREILGGNFLVAVVNDAAGFRECQLLHLKGRRQPEFWENFRQQGLADWFPVPGPYAVRLLEEAQARQAGGEGDRTYAGLRERIWKYWGRPEEAPDLEQAPPADTPGEQSRLLEHSRHLATDPWFYSWMPGPAELAPWLEKLREIHESPLVLSDQQKQVRTDALFDEAARALYPPESRPRWRRRLLAMAYYLELSRRPEEARMARAAASDLAEAQRGPLAGENPFLKSLVSTALVLAWEQAQKSRQDRPSGGLLSLPKNLTRPADSRIIRR
jgi:hypothetical protein